MKWEEVWPKEELVGHDFEDDDGDEWELWWVYEWVGRGKGEEGTGWEWDSVHHRVGEVPPRWEWQQ